MIVIKTSKILTFPLLLRLHIFDIDQGEEWGGASSIGGRHPKEEDDGKSASPSCVEEMSTEGRSRGEAGETMAASWTGGFVASMGGGRDDGGGRTAAVVGNRHGLSLMFLSFLKRERRCNGREMI